MGSVVLIHEGKSYPFVNSERMGYFIFLVGGSYVQILWLLLSGLVRFESIRKRNSKIMVWQSLKTEVNSFILESINTEIL